MNIIDRLLRARKNDYDRTTIERARKWLHGYMAKLGTEPSPHPPDDHILAQFLAVADWPPLERLLYDLLAERKRPGWSYAWFVTVALQRIHGIDPKAFRARRAHLKLVAPTARRNPDPAYRQLLGDFSADELAQNQQFAGDLVDQLARKASL
jgi:hypothetical protein